MLPQPETTWVSQRTLAKRKDAAADRRFRLMLTARNWGYPSVEAMLQAWKDREDYFDDHVYHATGAA